MERTYQFQLCLDIGDRQYFHVVFITWNVKMDIASTCKRCYKLNIEKVSFIKVVF